MLINLQNMKLDRGHEFNPKDQDAIFFLNQKVSGMPSGEPLILELDPYDVKQLPDIFSATDKLGSLYFFTKLRRKSTIKHSSTNIDRTVRDLKTKVVIGNWHGDSNIEIKDGRPKKVIGTSRKLSYRPAAQGSAAASSRNRNRYIMTEYLLPSGGTNYDIFKDGVLCRLVRSNRCKDEDDFPSEEEVEATPSETLAASEDSDELLDNPAANSCSPMAGDSPHTYEVEAPMINNLPLDYSIPAALEIQPLQTLVDVDQHAGDNQGMDYYLYAAEVEATPSEILAASEDSDDHELRDSIQQAFDEILEDNDGDDELLDITAANSCSPMAADSPHTYEVEAPTTNNLPLEYSIPAALEIPPRQTLVDVDQHAGDNQVMGYYSYAAEVEATPNPVDDLPVLSTAVEIPPPYDIFDFEDCNEEPFMAMNFEDLSQMIDWTTLEPFVGEDYSTAVGIPHLDQTQVASLN